MHAHRRSAYLKLFQNLFVDLCNGGTSGDARRGRSRKANSQPGVHAHFGESRSLTSKEVSKTPAGD